MAEDAEPPPLSPVVSMVLTMHKLAVVVSALCRSFLQAAVHGADISPRHTLPDEADISPLADVCVETITQCNLLAVSILGVLKTSEAGKGLSAEVQTHAHPMIQAGKTLNQLIKKGIPFPPR